MNNNENGVDVMKQNQVLATDLANLYEKLRNTMEKDFERELKGLLVSQIFRQFEINFCRSGAPLFLKRFGARLASPWLPVARGVVPDEVFP